MSAQVISVGVNLLPPRFAVYRKQRKMAILNLVIGILVLLALTTAWVAMLFLVNQARDERDKVNTNVSVLQTKVDSLSEYRTQADQLENANTNLAFAMKQEVSWAQILNDLTSTVPPSASLDSFTGNIGDDALTDQTNLIEGKEGFSIGNVTTSGYSIQSYSPGIESILSRFAESTSYVNEFISNAAKSEVSGTQTHTFNATFGINSKAFTERYANGLPEVEE